MSKNAKVGLVLVFALVIAFVLSQVIQVKEEGWVTDLTFDRDADGWFYNYRIEISNEFWVGVNEFQWGQITTLHWCEISSPILGSWRIVDCWR